MSPQPDKQTWGEWFEGPRGALTAMAVAVAALGSCSTCAVHQMLNQPQAAKTGKNPPPFKGIGGKTNAEEKVIASAVDGRILSKNATDKNPIVKGSDAKKRLDVHVQLDFFELEKRGDTHARKGNNEEALKDYFEAIRQLRECYNHPDYIDHRDINDYFGRIHVIEDKIKALRTPKK